MNKTKSDYPVESPDRVVAFLDDKFSNTLEFAANDFNAVVGFFEKRKFSLVSAKTLAQVLLAESKKSNVKVFVLLDKLEGLNNNQLNALMLKILNDSRDKVTRLGFRTISKVSKFEERNIVDKPSVNNDYSDLTFDTVYDISNIRIGVENQGNILLTQN